MKSVCRAMFVTKAKGGTKGKRNLKAEHRDHRAGRLDMLVQFKVFWKHTKYKQRSKKKVPDHIIMSS
jgi:hypothetical protein